MRSSPGRSRPEVEEGSCPRPTVVPPTWIEVSDSSRRHNFRRRHASLTWPIVEGPVVAGFGVARVYNCRHPRRCPNRGRPSDWYVCAALIAFTYRSSLPTAAHFGHLDSEPAGSSFEVVGLSQASRPQTWGSEADWIPRQEAWLLVVLQLQ